MTRATIALLSLSIVACAPAQDLVVETGVTDLVNRLRDPDPGKRYSAVIALGRHDTDQTADALKATLEDPADYVRVAVLQNLRKLSATQAIPVIIGKSLRDRDYFVRVAARGALRALTKENLGYDPDASPADREAKVRAWEGWWARNGDRFPRKVRPPTRPAKPVAKGSKPKTLDEAHAQIRALEADIRSGIGILEQRLRHQTSFVRVAALESLRRIGSRASVPAVIEALDDAEGIVRRAAMKTLRGLTGENFGYDPDAHRDGRRKVARTWAVWWQTQQSKR